MIYELEQSDYHHVQGLFRPLMAFQPFCTAVLSGVHPGRVFVDDPRRPQAAFLARTDPWCFLAGSPHHDAFNQALNWALFDRQAIGPDATVLYFTCHPQDWHGPLARVCHPREPVPALRRHYVGRALACDWRSHLPDGCTLLPLDGALLHRPGLDLPDEVRVTLDRWRALAGPRFQDFGFVTLCDGEVASWATVDAVAAGTGDIGFFTLPPYRRRGLATVAAAAAVEWGLAHGLSHVNWTCAEDNLASIRIAQKLGFERRSDYRIYLLAFDEAQHLTHLAYSRLQAGRYRESLDLYARFLARQDDMPPWFHHDVARAWAGLGDGEKAFDYLRAAAERGWSELVATVHCPEFDALRHTPAWAAVLARIRQNRDAQAGPRSTDPQPDPGLQ